MIVDLINYSLDQNHQTFSIEEIDSQLLTLNIKNKKYVIYFAEVSHSGGSRNPEEIRIQLSVSIKHKLIGYTAEDYKVILLGFDKGTNTFTFWRYDNNFETNTKQSLYTRKNVIEDAKQNGFSKYYYKKRDAFNNRRHDQRSLSLSVNAFLFPLVLKNFSKIFDRDFVDTFKDKIKRHNFPYSKDDLLLSLYLYCLDRKTKNIDKNDPELLFVSKLCEERFKILGFSPLSNFIPEDYVKKFRNINGIYRKTQNFKFTDPNEVGGSSGGARGPQQKIWDIYFKENKIDKNRLTKDSKNLIDRIKSKNLEILIGKEQIFKTEQKGKQIYTITSHLNDEPELLDIEINKEYQNRIINPNNFKDKIEGLNQIDKANQLHEKTINNLAIIFKNKGLPIHRTIHIDFFSHQKNKGYLFEVKTFNKINFKEQIRHGIMQLKEYFFTYAVYWKKIPISTNLYLLVDRDPEKLLNDIQKKFLLSEKIKICWILNNQVVTLKKEVLF